MADHRELVFKRPAAMNVPVAAAHWTFHGTEISSNRVEQRFAKCGPSGLVANQRPKHVALVLVQKHSARRAHCFLTRAKINAADDHAAAVQASKFILENPRQEHPTEGFEITLVNGRLLRRRFFRRGLFRFFAALRRLKHRAILPKNESYAQNFFETFDRGSARASRASFGAEWRFTIRKFAIASTPGACLPRRLRQRATRPCLCSPLPFSARAKCLD